MGLLDIFKSRTPKRFVSENDFRKNLSSQLKMTPQTLEQLKKLDIDDTKELKLEYFFYTNSLEKAKIFADQIKADNFNTEYHQAAIGKDQFVITGWTNPMKMDEEIVGTWTKKMCELGYKHDCEFDGWGTNPDQ